MKKRCICLVLILLSISLFAISFEDNVPSDVDYVIRVTNIESALSTLSELTENRIFTAPVVMELSKWLLEGTEIMIYGNFHLDPQILELRLDNLDIKDILNIFLNQKIALMTNVIPYEFIIDLFEAQLRRSIEQDGFFYSESESIKGRRVTNYTIDIIERNPPMLGNVYLYKDTEKLIISSDKKLLEKTFKAEDDANYRLSVYSSNFKDMASYRDSLILWYNQGAVTSWLLFRFLGLDYPRPFSETLRISIDETGNIEAVFNIDLIYDSEGSAKEASEENKPIGYFEKIAVPKGVDTLFSTRGFLLNLNPVLDLLEDYFDLPKFTNLTRISELLFIPMLFRNISNHSNIWFLLEDPDILYMLGDTVDVKKSIEIFSGIFEEKIYYKEKIHYASAGSIYAAGIEGENWFELSAIFPKDEALFPMKNHLPEMKNIYPEVIEEIKNTNSEVAHLIFSQDRLLFFSSFDNQGDLDIHLKLDFSSTKKFVSELNFPDVQISNFTYRYDEETLKRIYEIVISNNLEALKSNPDIFFNYNYPLDSMANTAMHLAARNGYTEMLSYLLTKRARSDIPNFNGQSPLHLAALFGFTDIVNLLIESGVDINRQDIYGKTALLDSSISNHIDVATLLLKNGAITDIVDEQGYAPIMAAAQNDNLELVKILVDSGVNLNAADARGNTALDYAEKSGSKEIIDFLINCGAIE